MVSPIVCWAVILLLGSNLGGGKAGSVIGLFAWAELWGIYLGVVWFDT